MNVKKLNLVVGRIEYVKTIYPSLLFLLMAYTEDLKIKAINNLKDVGIIKQSYNPERANAYMDKYYYINWEKNEGQMEGKFCVLDNPNIMEIVTDEMKNLIKYFHISTKKPFNIAIFWPQDPTMPSIMYQYWSERYRCNDTYHKFKIYQDYVYDNRRFDRSDVHFKYIPSLFVDVRHNTWRSSWHKVFTDAESLKKEIDIDIEYFNRFMNIAKPYFEESSKFDELYKLKKQKEEELYDITNKLEQEIGDIKDKLSALEAKNKNEFVKKLDLASDFEV